MASKKQSKSTKTETKSTPKKTAKHAKRFSLPHIEFSKITVSYVLFLVTVVLGFSFFEMHRLHDLSPLGEIVAGTMVCLGIVILSYMKRAHNKDTVDLEIQKTKKLSELKKKSGEDFVYERIEDVDLTV